MRQEVFRHLWKQNESRIILLVMDGLGGLGRDSDGLTELEAAKTPILDRLAKDGAVGQTIPIGRGITPGSGPAHLSLFGYDPIECEVGRGVLEATGIGMDIELGDIAARGNFVTLDSEGKITDRRAGRLPTEESKPLVEKLNQIEIPDVSVEVRVVKEYRFAVVMRGDDLHPEIDDTDPQMTGVEPDPAKALEPQAQRTAELFQTWIHEARQALKDQPKANGFTMRGFSTDPRLPKFEEVYGLDPACIAVYPMYKGVSKLVGMQAYDFQGDKPEDEFREVARLWDEHTFFFVHIKKTDSMGEDGNFDGKVKIIESVDAALPALLDLNPDVLAVTGDHSTPSRMRQHSWHPVPFLLWAPETIRADSANAFGETACASGGLGTFHATAAMPMMLAHANRLEKFGA
jgi:2,3-bisphosphoglycerate-independent phosphoglycerate mutase